MNLQKLRQVCYRNQYGRPEMKIILDPNDLKNRMEYTRTFYGKYTETHTAQAVSIAYRREYLEVHYNYIWDPDDEPRDEYYDSEDDLIKYNIDFSDDFLPRLKQILVDNGFHSRYLPYLLSRESEEEYKIPNILYYDGPKTDYYGPKILVQQITHACYYDGRSMRAAVEFQAELNKK